MSYGLDKLYDKNQFYSFLEKRKYMSSPIIYKIIYDKYNRPDLYKKIGDNKITEIAEKKEIIQKTKNDFTSNKANINCESFQENLVYSFYNNLSEDKTLIFNLIGLNIFQFAFIKTLSLIKFESRLFVFLDNNRAIFNRLINANKGLITFMKFNLVITSSLTAYFIFRYLAKRYFTHLEEESQLLNTHYKRSYLLYNKIF